MTWEIKQNNESLELGQEKEINGRDNRSDGMWKLKKSEYMNWPIWLLVGFINIAEGLDRNNMTEAEAWKTLMKCKKKLLTWKNGAQCMDNSKIPDVLFELGQEMKLTVDFNTWLPDDDSVILGFQMYEALLYCPGFQEEAKRLSLFFESLLTDQSLGTVLSATFNNLEPRRGNGWNEQSYFENQLRGYLPRNPLCQRFSEQA